MPDMPYAKCSSIIRLCGGTGPNNNVIVVNAKHAERQQHNNNNNFSSITIRRCRLTKRLPHPPRSPRTTPAFLEILISSSENPQPRRPWQVHFQLAQAPCKSPRMTLLLAIFANREWLWFENDQCLLDIRHVDLDDMDCGCQSIWIVRVHLKPQELDSFHTFLADSIKPFRRLHNNVLVNLSG